MKRLNITLPEELERKLREVPNKSRFIAEALQEKMERMRKEKLDKLLVEGYRATQEEDRKISEAWKSASPDTW